MDRSISQTVLQKRKQQQMLKISFGLSIFIAFVFLLRFAIKPSINTEEFYFAIAEKGIVEASISASGTVIPEFEEVRTSPISSYISEIFHNTGDKVQKGDAILELDKKETQSALEKMKDELNLKRNRIDQMKLNMERTLIDLKTNFEIKKLHVENMEAELKEEKYLLEIGGGTKEKIEKAELSLKITRLELEQIKQKISNQEKSMKADLLSLQYEVDIQQKSVIELQEKLEHSTITADKEGVITWISDQIGKAVGSGEELVKIANLQSYEITGTISDMHINKVHVGGPVKVRINENTDLSGEIINISPSVSGNTVQFKVKLDEKDHKMLRPNLKVDVFVITSLKNEIVRVKNGAFYKGAVNQKVFVKKGEKLFGRDVTFGDSNFDFVEIVSGIEPGEQVVISDMSEYERHEELKIK